MKLPEIKAPYVPAADEPSPFTEHPNCFPGKTWGEWYKTNVIYPTHRAWMDERYPEKAGTLCNAAPVFGIDDLVMGAWVSVKEAIEETLKTVPVFRQPEHPPEMFIPATRIVRVIWVMDWAVRQRITPYEAMKDANEMKAAAGKTLDRQEVYLDNFGYWLSLGYADIRVRMVTDREQTTFSDFRIEMGMCSRTIVVNELVGENGRIAQTVASLWILDGEAIANFTNEEHFSENDLKRAISIFQISIGLLPNEQHPKT